MPSMNGEALRLIFERPKVQALGLFALVGLFYVSLLIGLSLVLTAYNQDFRAVFLNNSDQQEYNELTRNLLFQHQFIQYRFTSPVPETLRTPGYPFFAALVFTLSDSLTFLALGQIVLVAGAAVLVFSLGRRLVKWQLALLASFLYALDPTVIFHTFSMMSETLYVFLSLLGLWLLVLACESDGIKFSKFLSAGVAFGLAALTRPIILYILPIVLLGAGFVYLTKDNRKKLITGLFLAIISFAVIISPWLYRNYQAAGHASLSSVGSYNLLFYNMAEYLAVTNHQAPEAVRTGFLNDLGNPPMGAVRSFAYGEVYMTKVKTILADNPVGYLKFHLVKTVPFFLTSSLRSVSDVLGNLGLLPKIQSVNLTNLILTGNLAGLIQVSFTQLPFTVEQLAWLLICLAAAASLVVLEGRERRIALWLGVIIGAYAILTGPVAFPRYRLPAEPYLLILALAGLSPLLQKVYPWIYRYIHLLIGKSRSLSTEVFRYLIVGGLSFVADYVLFIALTALVGWHYLVSSTTSFVVGLMVNYLLSIYWVFPAKKLTSRLAEFSLFALIGGLGLVISNVLLWLLVDGAGIHYALSKLVATFIVLGWNFGVRKWFLF